MGTLQRFLHMEPAPTSENLLALHAKVSLSKIRFP
jgi:hypothetical protein